MTMTVEELKRKKSAEINFVIEYLVLNHLGGNLVLDESDLAALPTDYDKYIIDHTPDSETNTINILVRRMTDEEIAQRKAWAVRKEQCAKS